MNNNKIYLYIAPLLALIPLFIFRDYTPDNELRYISIVEEAIRNGSFFTFYNHGIPYADKPPLYFWLLMICRQLTGENSMLLISLFTLIPCAVILYITNKMIGEVKAVPMLMLCTSVMFLGATVVLRMDMLMVMFIVLALYNFYRLYTRTGSNANSYYLPINIFLALFSKGPVGILAPVVSIAVFLLLERRIKTFGRYLGWKQWVIIVGLSAVWFGCVFIEGGYDYLHNLLFKQTVGRSVNAFHHKEPIYYYLKTIWYGLAPWSLLSFVVIAKGFWLKIIQRNTLLKFFSVVVLSTFVMMSLVSSKIDIYLLPIYPFAIYLTVLLMKRIEVDWMIKTALIIPSALFALSWVSIFFLKDLLPILPTNLWLIEVGIAILSIGGILAVIYSLKGLMERAILSISVSLLATLFTVSFTIPEFNDIIGFKNLCTKAKEIAIENRIQSFSFYQFRSGENMDVYLNCGTTAVESIEELKGLKNTILFVQQREIDRQDDLRTLLEGIPIESQVGDYKIYVIK